MLPLHCALSCEGAPNITTDLWSDQGAAGVCAVTCTGEWVQQGSGGCHSWVIATDAILSCEVEASGLHRAWGSALLQLPPHPAGPQKE